MTPEIEHVLMGTNEYLKHIAESVDHLNKNTETAIGVLENLLRESVSQTELLNSILTNQQR